VDGERALAAGHCYGLLHQCRVAASVRAITK
jgi:hypothetical protein